MPSTHWKGRGIDAITATAEIEFRDAAVAVMHLIARNVPTSRPVCSRDPSLLVFRKALTDVIPAQFPGVTRRFLPFAPLMPGDGATRFGAYFSRLPGGTGWVEPSSTHCPHALTVVVRGSIMFEGCSLAPGDWIWIPGGHTAAYEAGRSAAEVLTILPGVTGFDRVFQRIGAVGPLAGDRVGDDFVTSRDQAVRQWDGAGFAESPRGVEHRVLPFAPSLPVVQDGDGRFFAWISRLEPNTVIPRHHHPLEQVADLKVVLDGSIHAKGQRLSVGDWLWAPRGTTYEFTAGPAGATLVASWPYN